jgi:hypothetical protein
MAKKWAEIEVDKPSNLPAAEQGEIQLNPRLHRLSA